jgi:hypothetical protein
MGRSTGTTSGSGIEIESQANLKRRPKRQQPRKQKQWQHCCRMRTANETVLLCALHWLSHSANASY